MTTPAGILSALKTQLANASALSYLQGGVMIGERDTVANFPYICLEVDDDDEGDDDVNANVRNTFNVIVIGTISHSDKDKQISGDTTTRGILNLMNDIKKAIDSDRTLGGIVVRTKIGRTKFSSNFPKRELQMALAITYRQTRTTRT